MRPGGVLPLNVPRSTDSLWKVTPPSAYTAFHWLKDDWAALLCSSRRQDAHWQPHQGDASQWKLLHLASLCSASVKYFLAEVVKITLNTPCNAIPLFPSRNCTHSTVAQWIRKVAIETNKNSLKSTLVAALPGWSQNIFYFILLLSFSVHSLCTQT